jgi:hypothetical protein
MHITVNFVRPISNTNLKYWVVFRGMGWVNLLRRPLIGLLHQPRMIVDDECGAVGGMRIGRGNRGTQRKPAKVSLFPPHPKWPDLGSNPVHRVGKPATNRLNYGTALKCRLKFIILINKIIFFYTGKDNRDSYLSYILQPWYFYHKR